MKIKSKIIDRGISHEKHMQEVLGDCDYKREYLNFNIEEYIKTGNCALFFKSLKRVFKCRLSKTDLQ